MKRSPSLRPGLERYSMFSVHCLVWLQLVWNDTKRVGCATVKCPAGGYVWTCNYGPGGNIFDQYPYSEYGTLQSLSSLTASTAVFGQ